MSHRGLRKQIYIRQIDRLVVTCILRLLSSVSQFVANVTTEMTRGRRSAFALRKFIEQLPADPHAADSAGAGANLVELGVAQQTPG
jgi:hypothetical protein